MAKEIIHLMPPHKAYLEPFAGSMAVFLNKPKAILETVNDIDGRLINLFRQMRENPNELARLVYYTLYAREEYKSASTVSNDELEDARRMLVRCWMGVGGKTNAEVGFRRNIHWNGPYNTFEWNDLPNRIFEVSKRLKDAQIENKDAVQLIAESNQKDILIYCDPPYTDDTRVSKHYQHEMTIEQHNTLLQTLKAHSGPVILSGYDNDLYGSELSDWNKISRAKHVGITSAKKRVANEILWTNFPAVSQLHLFE